MKHTTTRPDLESVNVVELATLLDKRGIETNIRHDVDEALVIEHDASQTKLDRAIAAFLERG